MTPRQFPDYYEVPVGGRKLRTMGLDLSLTSTGISVGGATDAIAVQSRGVARLVEIRDSLLALVRDNAIGIVAVEGYAYGVRNSHSHSLGELGGVIRVALHEEGVLFVDISPTARAKFATGKGNAGKAEVMSSISAKTGIVWEGASGGDRCDAWVLEQMLVTHYDTGRYTWAKPQLDALTKVEWKE